MGLAKKEIVFDEKEIIDSLQHIYDQLQMINQVLDVQVDQAIQENFQAHNQQINEVMKIKSKSLQN